LSSQPTTTQQIPYFCNRLGAKKPNLDLFALGMIDRDFNDADYDMLLKLDDQVENVKGAKSNRINSLPVSIAMQNEPCCICLVEIEKSQQMKTLPCLHHFHIECIDKWLQINACCPIDKKQVFQQEQQNRCD